jgi:hypothetical protein
LGLKREDRPAAFAGHSESRFFALLLLGYRSCLHRRVSYPTRVLRQHRRPVRQKRNTRKPQTKSDDFAENERDALHFASKIGLQYEKDDANREVLLQYLSDNGLSLTAENLATAFDAGKSKLKLSQKIQQYNGTTVVDFGERVQNPSKC